MDEAAKQFSRLVKDCRSVLSRHVEIITIRCRRCRCRGGRNFRSRRGRAMCMIYTSRRAERRRGYDEIDWFEMSDTGAAVGLSVINTRRDPGITLFVIPISAVTYLSDSFTEDVGAAGRGVILRDDGAHEAEHRWLWRRLYDVQAASRPGATGAGDGAIAGDDRCCK